MSDKYIFDVDEKTDFVATLRLKLQRVKENPQDYQKGYAEKLEKLISAYVDHPDAQLAAVVREV